MRNKVLFLFLILLGVGIYDFIKPFLGAVAWYWLWTIIVLMFLLWIYYALLVSRASIQVRPKSLRLQGPLYAFNISYGRIHSVTSAHIGQHYPKDTLKGREKAVLEPVYTTTCVFIELTSYPKSLRWLRLWFPRYLFGTSRPGLICAVPDWIALSRDVETYRTHRYERVHNADKRTGHSLVADILADE